MISVSDVCADMIYDVLHSPPALKRNISWAATYLHSLKEILPA